MRPVIALSKPNCSPYIWPKTSMKRKTIASPQAESAERQYTIGSVWKMRVLVLHRALEKSRVTYKEELEGPKHRLTKLLELKAVAHGDSLSRPVQVQI